MSLEWIVYAVGLLVVACALVVVARWILGLFIEEPPASPTGPCPARWGTGPDHDPQRRLGPTPVPRACRHPAGHDGPHRVGREVPSDG